MEAMVVGHQERAFHTEYTEVHPQDSLWHFFDVESVDDEDEDKNEKTKRFSSARTGGPTRQRILPLPVVRPPSIPAALRSFPTAMNSKIRSLTS